MKNGPVIFLSLSSSRICPNGEAQHLAHRCGFLCIALLQQTTIPEIIKESTSMLQFGKLTSVECFSKVTIEAFIYLFSKAYTQNPFFHLISNDTIWRFSLCPKGPRSSKCKCIQQSQANPIFRPFLTLKRVLKPSSLFCAKNA